MTETLTPAPAVSASATTFRKIPSYRVLWVQVLMAIVLAVVLGCVDPPRAIAMKPLGDVFIRMITMIIFCTVVTGIAGMENLKKVGRVGGLALLYFEIVSGGGPACGTDGGSFFTASAGP
ncbi:MAG: cation:dicarboxylase symporter family transporter [Terriglobales bacterium]